VYARNENLEIYDILVGEFGDQAADAIVSGIGMRGMVVE
jgi:hypothetical protein